MLIMSIFTWEPDKREEVIKRRAEWKCGEEVKLIGEWIDLAGGRAFILVDTDDPKALLAEMSAWTDLGKLEKTPVMEAEEAMKLIAKE